MPIIHIQPHREGGSATKKLKNKAGFTLTELLCVIVVLVLVSACMVTGVQFGTRVYAKSVSYSEAQVLCSTLATRVSDELRYAGEVGTDNGKVVFFSPSYGKTCSFTSDATTGQILLNGQKLLPSASYPYGIRANVTLESYENQMFTVEITVTDSGGAALASTNFQVEKLNQ